MTINQQINGEKSHLMLPGLITILNAYFQNNIYNQLIIKSIQMIKYSRLALFLAATALASCNSEPKQSSATIAMADTANPGKIKVMIPNIFCYSTRGGKDTVFLKTEVYPNVVTGSLSYKIYEKDSNTGTIDGTLKGDTLIADYTFMSEGQSSVRQVAFIIKNAIATEGYGAMEEKEGKMVFTNLRELDFNKGIKLQKVECPLQ